MAASVSTTTHAPQTGMQLDVSPLSSRRTAVLEERKRACEAQELQAQKMVKRSRRVLVEASIGDNVTIPIPAVDRGRTDPRNLIGVITDKDDKGFYQIAVKNGVLDEKFSRNQFDVCAYSMYCVTDMNSERKIPLRKAVQEGVKLWWTGFCSLQL